MNKKLLALAAILVVIVAAVVIFVTTRGTAQESSWGDPSTDPQKLMIPRWFLSSLTHNGQPVELGDAQITLQFTEGNQANGSAGCNDFFADYEVANNGKLTFSQAGSTMMYCDNFMQQETAYLDALTQISQFKTEQGKLILSSADGQTTMTFAMPPK